MIFHSPLKNVFKKPLDIKSMRLQQKEENNLGRNKINKDESKESEEEIDEIIAWIEVDRKKDKKTGPDMNKLEQDMSDFNYDNQETDFDAPDLH